MKRFFSILASTLAAGLLTQCGNGPAPVPLAGKSQFSAQDKIAISGIYVVDHMTHNGIDVIASTFPSFYLISSENLHIGRPGLDEHQNTLVGRAVTRGLDFPSTRNKEMGFDFSAWGNGHYTLAGEMYFRFGCTFKPNTECLEHAIEIEDGDLLIHFRDQNPPSDDREKGMNIRSEDFGRTEIRLRRVKSSDLAPHLQGAVDLPQIMEELSQLIGARFKPRVWSFRADHIPDGRPITPQSVAALRMAISELDPNDKNVVLLYHREVGGRGIACYEPAGSLNHSVASYSITSNFDQNLPESKLPICGETK